MRTLITVFSIIACSIGYSQETETTTVMEKKDTTIETVVDEQAEFPGGKRELLKFLVKEIEFSKEYLDLDLDLSDSKVTLKFVVEEDGTITNIKMVRGISDCPKCNQEAIRVVKLMPNWTPAKKGGKIVRSYFILPIQLCTE